MTGRLIAFSGVDCAGKSTQIDLLEFRLTREGKRVERVWLRPGYSKRLDALRGVIRRRAPGALPAPSDAESRRALFAARGLRRVYVAAALLDLAYEYAARVRAKLLMGATVICDRYVEDAMIDIELRFPDEDWSLAWLAIRAVCPEPDAHLLLMLPEVVMVERMAQKREPFRDEESVRLRRLARYEAFAREGKAKVIPAADTVEAVEAAVAEAIGAACV